MNKRDLVVSLSERLSLTQSQSVEIVNAWEGVLTDALQSGERLTLQGFGTFFAWSQTERTGRNPRTGETCGDRGACQCEVQARQIPAGRIEREKE